MKYKLVLLFYVCITMIVGSYNITSHSLILQMLAKLKYKRILYSHTKRDCVACIYMYIHIHT
jgi:hypothetical protein